MTDAERVILLRAALRPFVEEARKWLDVDPGHDDLTLLCAEEWGLLNRHCGEAYFTVGDFKRAVAAYEGTTMASTVIERNAAWRSYQAQLRQVPDREQARIERAFVAGWLAREQQDVPPPSRLTGETGAAAISSADTPEQGR